MTMTMLLTIVFLGVFVAYAIAAPFVSNIGRFLRRTWLYCPEHEEYARVGVHPMGAAVLAGYGEPPLSVRSCSLLKPGQRCDEGCLDGAEF
jgi:hypothetical protein